MQGIDTLFEPCFKRGSKRVEMERAPDIKAYGAFTITGEGFFVREIGAGYHTHVMIH